MRSVRRTGAKRQTTTQLSLEVDDGTVSLAMIQALIPLGLRAVGEALEQEVRAVPATRPPRRWSAGAANAGRSILPIRNCRCWCRGVRDRHAGRELPLPT